ncbi:MAG: hypothetical protein ABH896_02415 [Candidatus Jacksonbacteria bacterium]
MKENLKIEPFIATRHTKDEVSNGDKESGEYLGVTEDGVELAREKAMEILEILEKSQTGTVMFIGGASEASRTKATARLIGDEIKRIVKEESREDIEVLAAGEIVKIGMPIKKVIKEVEKMIQTNPQKKFLIDFPLFLKNFGARDLWKDMNGKGLPYREELLAKVGDDHTAFVREWIANAGVFYDEKGNPVKDVNGRPIKGPNPTQIAKRHLEGIKRLTEFARRFIGQQRPLIIGFVGHSWNLDALLVYLANEGKVNLEGYEKLSQGRGIIDFAELAQMEIKNNQAVLKYRDKEWLADLSKIPETV